MPWADLGYLFYGWLLKIQWNYLDFFGNWLYFFDIFELIFLDFWLNLKLLDHWLNLLDHRLNNKFLDDGSLNNFLNLRFLQNFLDNRFYHNILNHWLDREFFGHVDILDDVEFHEVVIGG